MFDSESDATRALQSSVLDAHDVGVRKAPQHSTDNVQEFNFGKFLDALASDTQIGR